MPRNKGLSKINPKKKKRGRKKIQKHTLRKKRKTTKKWKWYKFNNFRTTEKQVKHQYLISPFYKKSFFFTIQSPIVTKKFDDNIFMVLEFNTQKETNINKWRTLLALRHEGPSAQAPFHIEHFRFKTFVEWFFLILRLIVTYG